MAFQDGKKGYVGISRQDTAGTVETTAAIFLITEEWPSIKLNNPNYYAKEFRGAMGEIQNVYRKSSQGSAGAVSALATTDWLSYAWYGVLGKATTSGDAAGYTHLCTADIATLPIWTVFKGIGALEVEAYRDLTMKSLQMSFSPSERLKCSVDFEGGPLDKGTAALTPTYTTLRPLDYSDVAVSLGGAPNCNIESMDITVGRAPAFNKTMCTGNTAVIPNAVYPTTVTAEGSFTMLFEDYTEYEYWLGATGADVVATDGFAKASAVRALTITATSTGAHIGAGTTHDSITITIPSIIYDDADTEVTYDDRVRITFNWKAVHDATTEGQVAGSGTIKASIVSEVVDVDA